MRKPLAILTLAAAAVSFNLGEAQAKQNLPNCGNGIGKGQLCCSGGTGANKNMCMKSHGDGTYSWVKEGDPGSGGCDCGMKARPQPGK